MAYVEYGAVRAYRGLSEDGDEDLITSLIDRAAAIIESYTGRVFEARSDTTRTFDAVADVGRGDERDKWMGRRTLYLDEDLAAITTVTNGDSTTVSSSSYVTEPRNRTPYFAIRLKDNADVDWTYDDTPEGAISITGRWAYSTTPPADIVHATIRLTSYLYDQKDNAGELDRPIRFDGGVMLPPQLPKDIRLMLDPYVKRFDFT